MEAMKCCICGKTINGSGNNPAPVVTTPGAVCCDKCNEKAVIPARLERTKHTTNK